MNFEQTIDQKVTEKRLINEVKLLKKLCCKSFQFYQDDQNKLIFYFMFQGLDDTDLKGGCYIVKFVLAQNYPKSFGHVYILTPNGKFTHSDGASGESGRGALSFTFSDSKFWCPIYTLGIVMESIVQMFYDPEVGGISRIKSSGKEIHQYAADSIRFNAENFPDIWKQFSH